MDEQEEEEIAGWVGRWINSDLIDAQKDGWGDG